MAPIAALVMVLPVVMALAACAPTCTPTASVKVVFDDTKVVDVSCTDGCQDDSTRIERLGSAADRTWRFTFTGEPPAHLIVAGQDERGQAIDRTRVAPEWQAGSGQCAEGWSDDVRVPDPNA
jgi:hypothetical protein